MRESLTVVAVTAALVVALIVLAVLPAGCSKPASKTSQGPGAQASTPEKAVARYLAAAKAGNKAAEKEQAMAIARGTIKVKPPLEAYTINAYPTSYKGRAAWAVLWGDGKPIGPRNGGAHIVTMGPDGYWVWIDAKTGEVLGKKKLSKNGT